MGAATEENSGEAGTQRSCKTCWGYGLWAIGDPNPMGPMDAADGLPTRPCPECGANANPPRARKERS